MTTPSNPTADADLDRAIARVQKLLSKTKNGVGTTAEEAELAARLAQELMAKYNLDMAAVEAASPEARDRVERIKTEVESKTRYQWQRNLARWVAMANFCAYALHQTEVWVPSPTGRIRRRVFTDDGDLVYDDDGYAVREAGDYRRRMTHVFVGRKANVITAQLMFDYLVDAVERSLPEALQGPQRQSRQAFSWLEGCADQVCDRLLTRRQDLIKKHDAEQRAAAAAARAAWEAQQAAAAPPKGLPAHKPTEIKQAYDAAAAGAPALLQFIKAGKLRCIATGSSTRLPLLPDVPTVAEQGFKGFEMTQWYGLMAPSKMPKAHLEKLEKEAIAAARGKIVHDKLSQDTALAVGNTRAEFEAFIKVEQARWKPVIARAQIKPEGV